MTLATGSLLVAACAQGNHNEVLGAFEANLAAHDSATEALRLWCGARGLARDPVIKAQFVRGSDQPRPRDCARCSRLALKSRLAIAMSACLARERCCLRRTTGMCRRA